MENLKIIDTDWLAGYFADDPVRPHIPYAFRVSENRKSFALLNAEGIPRAIICTAFTDGVATTEKQLANPGNCAMFYTVWSYDKGAGRDIVFAVTDWIKQNMPQVDRFVTLSPPTEMARKFHTRNGAFELQHNGETVNFEYA
jgi:hypothetical protein